MRYTHTNPVLFNGNCNGTVNSPKVEWDPKVERSQYLDNWL